MINNKQKINLIIVLVFLVSCLLLFVASAATNIDSTYRWAWNDTIGWIDFGYSAGNVNVSSGQLTGYASSSVGFIALDCATTPNGNICGTSNFKVSNNGNGILSGWAYNDSIGWISFDSATASSSYFYQVIVDSLTGDFSGWAWNDIVGWISFNCNNFGIGDTCASGGGYDYKVKTNWTATPITGNLTSSVFDTQIIGGAAINSILWQGNQPNGTAVKFQISSSNSANGPWNYKGPGGSGAVSDVYSPAGPGIAAPINLAYHNNQRYFRYKVFLESNSNRTQSPRVDDVIINWSP